MIFIRRVSHLRDVQCLFFEINESGCEAFENFFFFLLKYNSFPNKGVNFSLSLKVSAFRPRK